MPKLNYLNDSLQNVDASWYDFLQANLLAELTYIDETLHDIALRHTVYPPRAHILRALMIPAPSCKAVIIGQDPYHGTGQANGLAFAVNHGIPLPPSLRNIRLELWRELALDSTTAFDATLETWQQQGVLLLNTSLTVIKDRPNSLAHIGWEVVTNRIIEEVSRQSEHCVFLLWGNYARKKRCLINLSKHLVLEAAHPSPLSATRGFLGCNHFVLANQFLSSKQQAPIQWV